MKLEFIQVFPALRESRQGGTFGQDKWFHAVQPGDNHG